jgi:hypothetical protein
MDIKENVQLKVEQKERLVKAINNLLKEIQAPGILQGIFGSYLDKEMDFEAFISSLENLLMEKDKFKNLIPVFNEQLEVEKAVDQEYGLLANYKPLFDEQQNLVGFVPSWIFISH